MKLKHKATITVNSIGGKKRLAQRQRLYEVIRMAIANKTPLSEVEKEFNVKFVKPI